MDEVSSHDLSDSSPSHFVSGGSLSPDRATHTDRHTPTRPSNEQMADAASSPLSKQEVVSALDQIPTFNVVTVAANRIVGLPDGSGGDGQCVKFFIDPDEAGSALVLAQHLQPDLPLRLAVTPLGTAFALVEKWAETPSKLPLRLVASSSVVAGVAEDMGATPDGFTDVPVFACDALMNHRVMPLFLSRADLAATWVAAGRPAEALPTDVTVTVLRKIVHLMLSDTTTNWRGAMFIAGARAIEKAQAIQEAEANAPQDARDEPPPLK